VLLCVNMATSGEGSDQSGGTSGGGDTSGDLAKLVGVLLREGLNDALDALNTALEKGNVKPGAPMSQLRAAIAEEVGWESSISDSETIGIKGPGGVTTAGPDYITYNTTSDGITLWDAKAGANPGSLLFRDIG
jgi:hypothetical protein